MGIGNQIRIARKAAGITQAELAAKVNLSRSHIGAIELDRYNPSISTLLAIANALDTPITDIMDVNAVHHITEDAFNTGTELGKQNQRDSEYYTNSETTALAQEAHDNPDLKILFDASRKLSPKDLKTVTNLVKSLTEGKNG